jgi:hypothetical protein
MSVVFDISPAKTYVIAVFAGLLLLAALVAYLETSFALRATIEHVLALAGNNG